MHGTTGHITIAEFVFFALALALNLYVLIKHRLPALKGWLSLAIICTVRTIGSGIGIHDEMNNQAVRKAGAIISSVAILPIVFDC